MWNLDDILKHEEDKKAYFVDPVMFLLLLSGIIWKHF